MRTSAVNRSSYPSLGSCGTQHSSRSSRAAARWRRAGAVIPLAKAPSAVSAGPQQPPTPSAGYLGTVISSDKKACWLAPKGGSKAAKGVCLFMHGFSQGPNAYYLLMRDLADAGLLVVAPVPPLAATPGKQQAAMVEFANHFQEKLFTNNLTGLPLASKEVGRNIALLGHSVGAGLSSHVAATAAKEDQPFKSVMYLAPQTEVVDAFAANKAIGGWPSDKTKSTLFGLQYGLRDTLAPPKLSRELQDEIKKQGLPIKDQDVHVFDRGTHVGFQDQVVLGDEELAPDVLPWLNPLLLALVTIGFPFASSIALNLRRWLGKSETSEQQKQLKSGADAAEDEQGAKAQKSQILKTASQAALVSPQDFALLEQGLKRQTARELQPDALQQEGLRLRGLWKATPDGLGPEEEVNFVSAEASTSAYYGLLLVAVVLLIALGWSSLQGLTDGDGSVPFLPLIGTAIAGYCVYEGWTNLQLLSYVNEVQRPQSRAYAKSFISSTLLK